MYPSELSRKLNTRAVPGESYNRFERGRYSRHAFQKAKGCSLVISSTYSIFSATVKAFSFCGRHSAEVQVRRLCNAAVFGNSPRIGQSR